MLTAAGAPDRQADWRIGIHDDIYYEAQVAVGHVDEEHRLSRDRFLPFFAQQAPATVVLEACGSAHHWARHLEPLGMPCACCPLTMCTDTSDAIRRIARRQSAARSQPQ